MATEQHLGAGPLESRRIEGLALGTLGVVAFSVSLPATRAAAPELGGAFVGLGRAVVAGLLAAALLALLREPIPGRCHRRGLAVVAFGVVLGFPLCSAIALSSLPSAHAAVVVGLLPAATAIFAVLRAHERPSLLFWCGCALGVVAVLAFAYVQGAGRVEGGDILLLLAIALGALGYAEGGRMARDLGGWRVICWALVLALPFILAPFSIILWRALATRTVHAGAEAWLGFAYVSVVSMFLGFFPWYRGMALAGVARVGQLQLLQPVLTLVWSALMLHERIAAPTIAAAFFVIAGAAVSVAARIPAAFQNGRLGSTPSLSGLTARAAESEVGNAARRS